MTQRAETRTTPRKAAQQSRSKGTVDTILRATARILVKDGYDRASTNKIAQTAGVSIGSLYQYFPSKEALVAALLNNHCDKILQICRDSALHSMHEPLEKATRTTIEALIKAHQVDPALHRVFLEQVPRVGGLVRLAEVDREIADIIKLYLDAHHHELRIKDTALASFIVVKAIEGVVHAVVLEQPDKLHQSATVDAMVDLVIRYLAKEK